MPTYEYECQSCGERMDFFQSITAGPKRKCPSCGALKLKRLISAGAGLLFKGSGFYTTDYRSSSYQAGERAAQKADTKPDSTSTPKSSGDGGSKNPKD